MYIEQENGDEDEAELEIQLDQPEPVVAVSLEEIRNHEDVGHSKAMMLLGVLDQEGPKRATTKEGEDMSFKEKAEEIEGPEPEEPSYYFEKEDFSGFEFVVLLQQNIRDEKATDKKPDVNPIEQQEYCSVVDVLIERGRGGIQNQMTDVGQNDRYEGNDLDSREGLDPFLVPLRPRFKESEGGEDGEDLDESGVVVYLFCFFEEVDNGADRKEQDEDGDDGDGRDVLKGVGFFDETGDSDSGQGEWQLEVGVGRV